MIVVFGAFEHQVLEEMGKPGPPRHLILGSDVIPDVDRHDRAVAVLVHQHVQTIVERAVSKRYVHQ